MTKLIGGLCILSGGLILRWMQLRERTRTMELLEGLISALARMETEIRYCRPPLPELLDGLKSAEPTELGGFFRQLRQNVGKGSLSEKVWKGSVWRLSLPDPCLEALDKLGTAFRGDEEGLLCSLEATAQALRRERDQLRSCQQADRQRISVCTLSGALLLIILLI